MGDQLRLMDTRDFINQISDGRISIRDVIPARSPHGNQVTYLEFPEYCQKLCDREGKDRSSLYHAIQKGINLRCLHRVNRSPIFKQKLEEVMSQRDQGDAQSVTKMFEDTVSNPYEETYLHKDRLRLEGLYRTLQEIEGNMTGQNDDSCRDQVSSLQGECLKMKGRLHKQSRILEDNEDEYTPKNDWMWREMSLKPHAFYTSGHGSDKEDPYPTFTEKQVFRYIPKTMGTVFDNGLVLPHYRANEGRNLQQKVQQMLQDHSPGLGYIQNNADAIKRVLPNPDPGSGFSISRMLRSLVDPDRSSGSEDESDSDSDYEDQIDHSKKDARDDQVNVDQLSNTLQGIASKPKGPKGPPEDDEPEPPEDEDDEDEPPTKDEDDEGQVGGQYYLDVSGHKGSHKSATFF